MCIRFIGDYELKLAAPIVIVMNVPIGKVEKMLRFNKWLDLIKKILLQ